MTGAGPASDGCVGGGDRTTRGPVHLDRPATTSARRVKSANSTLGCDFSWRQASLVGIVSNDDSAAVGTREVDALHGPPPHAPVPPQQPRPVALPFMLGQPEHGADDSTDAPMAVQKALPKTSSAQAAQFDGSPEQLAGLSELGREGSSAICLTTGKMGLVGEVVVRRRRGTGG